MSDESIKLPEGWEWAVTGDICEGIVPGRTKPKAFNGTIPWITLPDIDGLYISKSKVDLAVSKSDAEEVGMKIMPQGTILMSCVGQVGIVCITKNEVVPNQQLHGFICLDQTLPEYVAYALMTQSEHITRLASATTIAYINKDKCNGIEIPLAPIAEQKRIVAKIEELRSKTQKAREALEAIPEMCDRFRQSVLAAAFRGDLTADWREENSEAEAALALLKELVQAHEREGGHKKGNAAPPTDGVHTLTKEDFPETWEIIELRDLCKPNRPITYGILKPGPELEQGVPYIRVADFPNDQLNLTTIRKTSYKIDQQFSRSRLEEGDLLLSIRGTVGRTCIIPEVLTGANITQDSARLSIQEGVSTIFVRWMLKSKSTQQRMQKAVKGVAVRGINIGDVRAVQIPLPPVVEQKEIIFRIQELFKAIDLIQQQYEDAKARLEKLDRAILAKAFRGELVPQDPDDEPASVLLDRIRQERAKVSDRKSTKRKR